MLRRIRKASTKVFSKRSKSKSSKSGDDRTDTSKSSMSISSQSQHSADLKSLEMPTVQALLESPTRETSLDIPTTLRSVDSAFAAVATTTTNGTLKTGTSAVESNVTTTTGNAKPSRPQSLQQVSGKANQTYEKDAGRPNTVFHDRTRPAAKL